MKRTLISLAVSLVFTVSAHAQAIAACQTMEQQQAAYNKSKATAIAVRDTASQQLQCHYNQLATYYNQLDKDNQQRAKDIQQINKDVQQIARDRQLTEREASIGECDELDRFLEVLIPVMQACSKESVIQELNRIKMNRSSGGHGTSHGEHCNIQGFDNPHH